MKKLYYTILATAAALTTASCVDLLNTAPENQIASENMWTTPELALKGMNGLYETFYNRKQSNGTQVRSENLDGLNKYGIEALGFCTDYYANNYPIYLLYNQAKRANDWQLAHEWRFCYTIVHAANDAVTNLHKAGLDAPTYERYLCEARFLRAWAYSRLNKFWQGVPVYLEPISNEQCTRTQESAEYVWREVVLPDLKYCIDNASFPDNTLGESNFGRPSKGAAYALRGMAYMWLKEWQNAANDFEQVGQCGYDLWRGEYIDFFSPDNERDNEMIFAIQYDEESGYCDNIQQAVGARDTYGGWDEVKPASDFVDYYQNDDGTEFKWSQVTGLENWDQLTPRQRAVFFCRDGLKSNAKLASQKTQAIGICGQDIFDRYYLDNGNEARIKAAYDKRDPRLKQTIVTPYEPVDCFTAGLNGDENMIGKQLRWPLYLQGTSGGDFWLDKRTSAYYCYRKYVRFLKGELIDRQRCYTDFPLIRYTDVILQWAEALIELNEFTPAKNLIDQVRARAWLVVAVELAELVIAVPFAFLSARINPNGTNLAGIDANVALFGSVLLIYGVFNVVFLPVFYKTAIRAGRAFLLAVIPMTVLMVLVEALSHFPVVGPYLDATDAAGQVRQLPVLAVGLAAFALLSWLAYRKAAKNYERVDL